MLSAVVVDTSEAAMRTCSSSSRAIAMACTATEPPTGTDEGPAFVTRLLPPRPNPFNPLTTIEYSIAVDSHVTIRIFDAAGRVVRTLVDSQVEAGPHASVWDGASDAGSRAASGVYFLKMKTAAGAGAFRANRTLVLLK